MIPDCFRYAVNISSRIGRITTSVRQSSGAFCAHKAENTKQVKKAISITVLPRSIDKPTILCRIYGSLCQFGCFKITNNLMYKSKGSDM